MRKAMKLAVSAFCLLCLLPLTLPAQTTHTPAAQSVMIYGSVNPNQIPDVIAWEHLLSVAAPNVSNNANSTKAKTAYLTLVFGDEPRATALLTSFGTEYNKLISDFNAAVTADTPSPNPEAAVFNQRVQELVKSYMTKLKSLDASAFDSAQGRVAYNKRFMSLEVTPIAQKEIQSGTQPDVVIGSGSNYGYAWSFEIFLDPNYAGVGPPTEYMIGSMTGTGMMSCSPYYTPHYTMKLGAFGGSYASESRWRPSEYLNDQYGIWHTTSLGTMDPITAVGSYGCPIH